jgi:hypothetical protein
VKEKSYTRGESWVNLGGLQQDYNEEKKRTPLSSNSREALRLGKGVLESGRWFPSLYSYKTKLEHQNKTI